MKKKNLVLGAISGYSFEQLAPFIFSLRRTGFMGDIVFLYSRLSSGTLAELRKNDVHVVPLDYRGAGSLNSWSRFWPYIRLVMPVLSNTRAGRKIMKNITPLQTSRFYNYHDFIKRHANLYENVLITDVRDVIFQSDPFDNFNKQEIQCYEEDLSMKDEGKFNLHWIEELFGKSESKFFLNETILCSGTILGPAPKMIEYFQAFEKLLLNVKSINIGGSDQGVHNYLIRKKLFTSCRVVSNGKNEVLTISPGNVDSYPVDGRGFFIKPNSELIPIIHQYDRDERVHHSLINKLAKENGG
jgi:hypothetical protein